MSVEAPNFLNQYDPSLFKPEFGDNPAVLTGARDMLESRRARMLLMTGAMAQTVEADPAVAEAAHRRISDIALDRIGGLAVGFTGGVDDTAREIFGAKPVQNVYRPNQVSQNLGALMIAA